MTKEIVKFKGNTRDGLYLQVSELDFPAICIEIEAKLKTYAEFYKGCNVIKIQSGIFDEQQRLYLEQIFDEYLNAKVEYYSKINVEPDKVEIEVKKEKVKLNAVNHFEGIEEDYTLFVKTTMRSGQDITYNGSVVVFGDVNPGAEITATGNIIVYGTLRGIAHAGCEGDKEAIVYAKKLHPIQLRIADLIAISPEEEYIPQSPEIAKVIENQVVIEPC